jgi:hypothetical protein
MFGGVVLREKAGDFLSIEPAFNEIGWAMFIKISEDWGI